MSKNFGILLGNLTRKTILALSHYTALISPKTDTNLHIQGCDFKVHGTRKLDQKKKRNAQERHVRLVQFDACNQPHIFHLALIDKLQMLNIVPVN